MYEAYVTSCVIQAIQIARELSRSCQMKIVNTYLWELCFLNNEFLSVYSNKVERMEHLLQLVIYIAKITIYSFLKLLHSFLFLCDK